MVIGEGETVCIFTNDVSATSETFVRRHIAELCDGQTVVMTRKGQSVLVDGKPVLIWKNRDFLFRSLLDVGAKWPIFTRFYIWLHRGFFKRFGVFVKNNNVKFIVAEFGSQGVKVQHAARHFDIPMLCYFRGYDASKKLEDRGYVRSLKHMMPNISGIVAVSDFLVRNLAEKKVSHSNTLVIPSGVDTQKYYPKNKDRNLLLFVGRFVEKKHPKNVILAFAAASKEFPDVRLEMIGDGPEFAACVDLVQSIGLDGKVVFHGVQNHEFVMERMMRTGLFLQHSITASSGDAEGLPSAIQEAMACGAVVLATRHAGIPEIITQDITGVLVEEHDLEGFSQELIRILKDGPLRERISQNARVFAKKHLEYRLLYEKLEKAMFAVSDRDL